MIVVDTYTKGKNSFFEWRLKLFSYHCEQGDAGQSYPDPAEGAEVRLEKVYHGPIVRREDRT